MSPSKRTDEPREIEFEQEVDFGRYLRKLARGWWLLLAGLVIGAVIGVALTLGGSKLYKAKATIYLGQPLAINSSAQIQSLSTNPSTVSTLVHDKGILDQVAKQSGLPLKKLSAGISTATVQGSLSKLGQTPLVSISVQANAPRKAVTDAANDLAAQVLAHVSDYPHAKIAILHAQIASDESQIAAIDKRLSVIGAASSSSTEPLVLLTRRGTLSDEVQTDQLLLAQAKTVEQGKIVTAAKRAAKTASRSRKSGLLVGGALGLLIGALTALALPETRRRRSS
ncbi:MAG: Wzz/FepE/Etk N-terminal domain-containing protein [Gaiellaceae bacterium]